MPSAAELAYCPLTPAEIRAANVTFMPQGVAPLRTAPTRPPMPPMPPAPAPRAVPIVDADLATIMQAETPLDAALAWAALGRKVFPVKPASAGEDAKKPYWRKGDLENGHKSATCDPDLIRSLWKSFPKADLGLAMGDGLMVLDIDTHENQPNGFDSLKLWSETLALCLPPCRLSLHRAECTWSFRFAMKP